MDYHFFGNVVCLLWIYFPVWRELKLELVFTGIVSEQSDFGYTFPFEGNWNGAHQHTRLFPLSGFGYTFPFEGNWNSDSRCVESRTTWNFGYTFPFEGNWNFAIIRLFVSPLNDLWIYFPVWRELKLDSVSFLYRGFLFFGYTFPFEGNWNYASFLDSILPILIPLDILSRLKGIETKVAWLFTRLLLYLWIYFPVWRELKLDPTNSQRWTLTFGYTFPFEGNWNF